MRIPDKHLSNWLARVVVSDEVEHTSLESSGMPKSSRLSRSTP
jgi:hypothetical protein